MSPARLLVGGFGVPPFVLRPLARDVGGTIVPTGLTIGCGEVEARKVIDAIDRSDGPVTLIGHSRGGQLAHVAARRRPDRVIHLVTAGTPRTIGPPDRPGVAVTASILRRIPNPIGLDCATADCCAAFRRDLATRVAVPWTALWSRRDRIVPPHDALLDGANQIEIDATHLGLVTSRQGRNAIARVL